ncbi:MAG: hypothetical protein Q8N44_13645 [Rubrivivax sp.]|nr:hypothetical protein [Rubrivivax sp.]
MDTPNTPKQATDDYADYLRMHKLLELKEQMAQLHANLETLRLLLKLGVGRP